jgi:hypothetical protein
MVEFGTGMRVALVIAFFAGLFAALMVGTG